jgi:hypothetical protein
VTHKAVLSAIVGSIMLASPGCGSGFPGPGITTDVSACLSRYHPATPDPMPTHGPTGWFLRQVTYATPCPALSPAGPQLWMILVVAHDDRTIRAYFVGGPADDRCDLLRSVELTEDSSSVTIQLEAGSDPLLTSSSSPQACSAVGQPYVTEVQLHSPLGSRKLMGLSNQGVVEHL